MPRRPGHDPDAGRPGRDRDLGQRLHRPRRWHVRALPLRRNLLRQRRHGRPRRVSSSSSAPRVWPSDCRPAHRRFRSRSSSSRQPRGRPADRRSDRAGTSLAGRRFSVFDVRIGEAPYQVVAGLPYRDAYRIAAHRGVRVHGEPDLGPIALFSGRRRSGVAHRRDAHRLRRQHSRRALAARLSAIPADARRRDRSAGDRRALFFDPRLVAIDPPDDLARETLTHRGVGGAGSRPAHGEPRRRHDPDALASAAGVALILGFVDDRPRRPCRRDPRAGPLRPRASVRSELKTPIATIRADRRYPDERPDGRAGRSCRVTGSSSPTKPSASAAWSTTCWPSRASPTSPMSAFDSLSVAEIVDERLAAISRW